jgi:gamma-glutamyltranspeptidase / glutathione hydrolase
MSAQDAVAAPNLYFAGDAVQVEGGTSLAAMSAGLAALGRPVLSADGMRGKANAAERTPQGWRGAADPRSEGVALEE